VIIDLGGDERLVRSILQTRVGTSFKAEDFWTSVFRFFVANPMLDSVHHGPIVDFVHHHKFEPSIPNPLGGQPDLIPAQPNLSMKGRTAESLLRSLREWHRSLAQGRVMSIRTGWGPSGFPGLEFDEGAGEDRRVYRIVELLDSEDLFEEGRAMRHCVATYGGSCASGRTSIWSLRKSIESGRVVRQVTIEVSNKARTIVQVRGRSNRLPTAGELAILESWGTAGGPALAYWMKA
jgi:hypothetical protein